MRKGKRFTLIEILAVIAIIGILILAIITSTPGNIENTLKAKAKAEIKAVKTALLQYQSVYGKPPKSIEDLFKKNNKRNIEFLEYDELPKDPLSDTDDSLQVITGVSSVKTKVVKNDRHITGGELGGNGFIVYSVGLNGVAEGNGDLEGGINDGLKEGKDDIAEYISF